MIDLLKDGGRQRPKFDEARGRFLIEGIGAGLGCQIFIVK